MSQRERTGRRDLTYSRWHRIDSVRRYLPVRIAWRLTAIDIDWCEACCYCSKPLALVETQVSDRCPKDATITAALARSAGIPAFSVSVVYDGDEVCGFRVRDLLTAGPVRDMEPVAYAWFLWSLRDGHECDGTRQEEAS